MDGRLRSAGEPILGLKDVAWQYGCGLYETLPVERGRPFLVAEHLRRMNSSSRALGMRVHVSLGDTQRALGRLLRAEARSDGVLRILLSPAEAPRSGGRVALEFRKLPLPLPSSGVRVVFARIRRSPGASGTSPWLARHKTMNRLGHLVEFARARRLGAAEALFLTSEDAITEGTWSNLFVVTGGVLRTAHVMAGILPGVTRAWVLRTARKLGLRCEERSVTLAELPDAAEVFLTSSVRGIVPVAELAGRRFRPCPGSVTKIFEREMREARATGGRSKKK